MKELELHDFSANLKRRIQLTKLIKKNEFLIRTAQGSRIHFYCFKKWEDRKVISGIVINPQNFFDKNSIEVSVNPLLSIDPISNA